MHKENYQYYRNTHNARKKRNEKDAYYEGMYDRVYDPLSVNDCEVEVYQTSVVNR